MKSASKNGKVVYTAVFGNYDRVPPVNPEWDCDFVCFTDNHTLVSSGWQILVRKLNGESPAQANRRYKILTHEYLGDYESSLYVDANIRILLDPNPLFKKYLGHGILAIPKHQDRNCTYAEAQSCIKRGLVDRQITNRQMEKYAREGFPEQFKMTENGIIFRKHNEKSVSELMKAWWAEYCAGGKRDQLSLPYLIWKQKIDVQEVVEGPRINSRFFSIELHESDKSKSLMTRLARIAHGRKHLAFHYFLVSTIVSLAVCVRDSVREKFLRS